MLGPHNNIVGPTVKLLPEPWPRWAIMASGPGMFAAVRRFLPAGRPRPSLWGGLIKVWQTAGITLLGPILGGPQALMALEFLKAAGVTDYLFLGSAGALKAAPHSGDLSLNDILLPIGFLGPGQTELEPYPALAGLAAPAHSAALGLGLPGAAFGGIWSRLTPFRATAGLVETQRRAGALAVDMECAYLASGSAFLGLNWAPVILISDELGPKGWRTGWREPGFKKTLTKIAQAAVKHIKALEGI